MVLDRPKPAGADTDSDENIKKMHSAHSLAVGLAALTDQSDTLLDEEMKEFVCVYVSCNIECNCFSWFGAQDPGPEETAAVAVAPMTPVTPLKRCQSVDELSEMSSRVASSTGSMDAISFDDLDSLLQMDAAGLQAAYGRVMQRDPQSRIRLVIEGLLTRSGAALPATLPPQEVAPPPMAAPALTPEPQQVQLENQQVSNQVKVEPAQLGASPTPEQPRPTPEPPLQGRPPELETHVVPAAMCNSFTHPAAWKSLGRWAMRQGEASELAKAWMTLGSFHTSCVQLLLL